MFKARQREHKILAARVRKSEKRRSGPVSRNVLLRRILVTLILGTAITLYLLNTNYQHETFEAYQFINCGLCLWLPLVVVVLFLGENPNDYGLGAGDRKTGLLWAGGMWAAMLPVLFLASHLHSVTGYYLSRFNNTWLSGFGPILAYRHGHLVANPLSIVYYELAMGFYMFCWEFFFRGFWLNGLRDTKLGVTGAIVIQCIPFVLLHWSPDPSASKSILEIIGSIPAGLILGFIAYKTKSIYYGYLAHYAVSATMDLMLLWQFIFR